jgi:hypothetical protein
MTANGINWWRTPAESPDLNPIECVWHELKNFIATEVKPRDQAQLIDGIQTFWQTMTPDKCCRYVNHIHKVIPRVIERNGEATGY